jgi:LPXTG-motif cell wall-anchored protein
MVINSTSSGASLTTSHSYASVISVKSALDSYKQYFAQIYNGSSYFKNNNNESVTLGDSSTASNWRIYRLYYKNVKHSYTITNYDTDSTSYNLDDLKLEHHKSIDALRDNIELKQDNPDTTLDDSSKTDLTDLYRLYLDITGEQTPVDVLFVLDQSESMNTADMDGSTRINELLKFLNGDSSSEGFISKFLDLNKYNRYAVVGFGSPGDIVTKEDGYKYTDDAIMRRDWGRDTSSIDMDAKMIGTNYDAALMTASDMFEGLGTTSDAEGDNIPHKRIMIFLSDGVPSVYITEKGNLNGDTDTALYSDNAKASAASAKLHFNEFLKNNLDVETYSVAFYGSGEGYSFDTSVLEYMAKGGGGVYKHVSDSEELEKFMEGICMPNNVSITDTLSDYVDYYSTQPDLKVVMTEKETGTQTVLYDYDEKTKTGTWDKNYIKGITVDGKKVELEFVDDYRLKPEYTYTLSFNVETTQQAYNEAAANRTEGDRGYKGIEGDPGSDYGQNQTSSEKEGFYSNKTAIVTYNIEGITKSEDYEKPVIQVADGAIKIKKVNMTQTDKTLSGAVFDLYRKAYTNESGVSVSGLSGSYVKVNTQEIKTGNDGMVEVDHLPPNTYYLVETEAPIGYDKMTSPQSFTLKRKTVTVPTGSSYITGETVTAEIPTLTVGNNPGLILPNTGGSGTTCYLLTGIILMLGSAGIYILMRRKGDIYS